MERKYLVKSVIKRISWEKEMKCLQGAILILVKEKKCVWNSIKIRKRDRGKHLTKWKMRRNENWTEYSIQATEIK